MARFYMFQKIILRWVWQRNNEKKKKQQKIPISTSISNSFTAHSQQTQNPWEYNNKIFIQNFPFWIWLDLVSVDGFM